VTMKASRVMGAVSEDPLAAIPYVTEAIVDVKLADGQHVRYVLTGGAMRGRVQSEATRDGNTVGFMFDDPTSVEEVRFPSE
jgi:hypothetical protein